MEEFQVSCQAGKELIDQGILYLNEQSHDQQTNMPGPTCQHNRPTCQHIRTNMPTQKDPPIFTEKKTRILNKQEILNCPK